ncbi:glycosyltransferase family 2 protein [Streptococcus sp. NLN76]|uniref:glycosyltransferase family 2 protein n=1 Tax=Streptococcus sp. NLN76 TaxID=2822800 RepID=UPI0018A9DF72|nr:glycosyltransferase family 2 protein [Streptococcus sp. NLN76]MBF8969468.1 glycosyltransferase family 2 protein [Streptococcus sp. NLN76]
MTVAILLSTYNGERYLAEMLDSILAQTVQDWQLLIRDDGSSDGTHEIIRRYQARDERIRWINPDVQENLGVIRSFWTLLQAEKAEYYAFSDQDDVWLPQKLQIQLDAMGALDPSRGALVYTDLSVVDHELQVIAPSMIKSQSDHANTTLLAELTENTVTGGVTLINQTLAQMWTGREEHELLMHDWYLGLLAASQGQLAYVDLVTQLYRQHDQNVLGARTLRKRMTNWIRPQLLFQKYWKLIQDSQEQARNLLVLPLEPQDRELVEDFVTILDQGLIERIRRIFGRGLRKNRWFHTLVFRTLIITKLFYKRSNP